MVMGMCHHPITQRPGPTAHRQNQVDGRSCVPEWLQGFMSLWVKLKEAEMHLPLGNGLTACMLRLPRAFSSN